VSVHAPGRRSSRLRCPRLGSERCRGAGLVKPEFSTRPDQNSPVTNGTAAHTSASHPPRVAGRPENTSGRAGDGDLSNRHDPVWPHDAVRTDHTVGASHNSRLAQASGWRESEEGSRADAGVKPQVPPSSDARRRIPASCPFPRGRHRQLRATTASLAASNVRSEASSCFHRPRYSLGEERRSRRPCLRD